jgi:peroxiredoxin Q/BCP
MDGEKGNKAFAQSLGLDYPILSDTSKEAAKAYGLINAEGRGPGRVTFYIGKDGKVLAIDRTVKAAQHGADIAAKLKELGVAEKK